MPWLFRHARPSRLCLAVVDGADLACERLFTAVVHHADELRHHCRVLGRGLHGAALPSAGTTPARASSASWGARRPAASSSTPEILPRPFSVLSRIQNILPAFPLKCFRDAPEKYQGDGQNGVFPQGARAQGHRERKSCLPQKRHMRLAEDKISSCSRSLPHPRSRSVRCSP